MMSLTDEQTKLVAWLMLQELERLKLTVAAVPDGRGSHRKIRMVIVPNPDWYSRMCCDYLVHRRRRWKRPRTLIKRSCTLRALSVIAESGLDPRQKYHERLSNVMSYYIATRGMPDQQTNRPTDQH